MIYIIGVIISFFLSVLAFTKKNSKQSDLILGFWLTIIALHLAIYSLILNQLYYSYSFLLGFNVFLPFFHGPLLYLYVRSFSGINIFRISILFRHFLLPVVAILAFHDFWIMDIEDKIRVFESEGGEFKPRLATSYLILELSGIFYLILTIQKLRIHKKRLKDTYSFTTKMELNWLKFIFWGMSIIWICIIFLGNDQLIFFTVSLFAILIGFFGIRQSGVFSDLGTLAFSESQTGFTHFEPSQIQAPDQAPEKEKYHKSSLREDSAKEIHQLLLAVMENQKPHLNPELNLGELAELVNTPTNHLSQVINEIEQVNFYDFINRWRVEEFKTLSQNPEYYKLTLTAIAYECGFNSKATFNRAFKKITGESPTLFLKTQKVS
ncbi:AraC family transcriptional regulator [Algoriphagus confluentis]|uniref:HTH araC/xylS-type domain-containing protein n=1 Tax=Algoriphagus confluentis TaxID=1697556 RepID=A0ABQ6PV62_9BACT|nr:hypothetical protein Aconfl_41610 [Algoriphagus confluentis]